jgi:hypothetical protein
MGYIKDNRGITSFTPDNTENELFIPCHGPVDMSELIEEAKTYFGKRFVLSNMRIEPRHIHTDCIGYPSYDPDDYTDYLVITIAE